MFQKLIINALFTQSIFIAVIRHILSAVGVAMVSQGWISNPDWNTVVGAVISIVGVGWSAAHHSATAQLSPPAKS